MKRKGTVGLSEKLLLTREEEKVTFDEKSESGLAREKCYLIKK